MRRWIIIAAALATLVLLALPLGALYYAVFTEPGLELIARMIPRHVGGVEIRIVGVRGTAARGVHVDLLEIDQRRVHLRFEGIDGRVSLAPLLLQTLRVPDGSVQRALIEIRPREHPVPSAPWHFLPYWLEIRADRVRIAAGTLVLPSGRRYDARELGGSAIIRSRVIRVFDATMAMDPVRVTAHGVLQAADPLKLDAEARISIRSAGQPLWVIEAAGRGDLGALTLNGRFDQPLSADFRGHAANLTGRWTWEGATELHDLDLAAWGARSALGHVSGRLVVHADANGFTADGPLTPAGLHVGAFSTVLEGSYADRVLTARRIELTHQASGARATGSGTIGLVGHGPRLDLAGTWSDFRWPLSGRDAALRSASGGYTLAGSWPYALRAGGTFELRGRDAIPFELAGTLDKQDLTVSEASLALLGGSAVLSGKVAWGPAPAWSVSGTATALDAGRMRPDFPGHVTFDFDASGGFASGTDLQLAVRNLSGRLRDLPAQASGSFSRRDNVWHLADIDARLGRASLSLAGMVSEAVDLRFSLDAPDLSLLGPTVGGRVLASGTIRGTAKDPAVDVVANASALRYAGIGIESLAARIDFDARRSGASLIDIRAHEITYRKRRFDQATFQLDGAAAAHEVSVSLAAARFKLQARAAGAFADGTWRGTLLGIDAADGEELRLGLEAPVAFALSREALRLDRLCLAGSPAHLCAEAIRDREHWSASIAATELPMSTLTAGLTPDVDYRGTISATIQALGKADEPAQGTANLKLTDARLVHKIANGRLETITLGTGTINVDATALAIAADLALDAGAIGSIKGHLGARRTTEAWLDMPLRGDVQAQTAQLDFLTLYAPQIDRAAGRLAADVTVAGTVGAPLVSGTVDLSDGELDLYQLNVAVRAGTLQARLTDNGLDFKGGARVGGGSASTQGHLEWREGVPFGRLDFRGESLRVTDVPEAEIDASPNLEFMIDGRNIAVAGTVRVPQARIVPADLTNAVRASPDEIVIGREAAPTGQRFKVVSDITIALGDRVTIDTSGLKGRLTGTISVRSGEEEITRATGELSIADGEYAAYGRRLEIDRGRLIFASSPIDNPGIDLRAVKRFQDAALGVSLAGINVRGTLRQPRMTFFSEPPLPQQQIVSLILAGGALAGGTQLGTGVNSQRGTNAELLGQGAAILGQQLGARVGISDVGVESNLNNETSLVLGRYLSPRLYVSWGISLTQSINTLKLRYSLGDHWVMRTEVGQVGGADLVYTIDK